MKSIISYRGIHREERLEFPVKALREAILNALIHRDYTGAVTQIRVNNNSLEIWNAGLLPEELKIEMLYGQHASIPRNRSLANLFFRAGYIESWGRGTIAIAQECKEYGLPAPSFNEQFGGFTIGFYKAEHDTQHDTQQIINLLSVISGEMTRDELQDILNLKDREQFRSAYLKPALEAGFIEMTLPKYRLTDKGNYYLKANPTKK